MMNNSSILTVLSIAGSDSGGGAGIQADLKTFTALGVFGTTALTCITAQSPGEVRAVQPVDPEVVSLQIKTVSDYFSITAAKTGMLYSAEIIESVAGAIDACGITNLIVDPVMVATSGSRLLKEDAVEALCSLILPKAAVITPNVPELEILWGRAVATVEDMKTAAADVGSKYGAAVVAKGGHLSEDTGSVVDVLWADGDVSVFSGPRIDVDTTHGTGCTFSAAMTASIALEKTLKESVQIAKDYVAQYISL